MAADKGEAKLASSLHGTLRYHEDLRHWISVELDRPACEQDEIQLVFASALHFRRAERFRDCDVTVTGKLGDSLTGYYSAAMAIWEPKILRDRSCKPAALKPDPSAAPIPKGLTTYRASITVDYSGRGHLALVVWRSDANRTPLAPAEAFADYMLTGGEDSVLFSCRKGFRASDVSVSPAAESRPLIPVDDQTQVLLDTERKNAISFTCTATGSHH